MGVLQASVSIRKTDLHISSKCIINFQDYASLLASPLNMSIEEKMEVDNRSIYVGNVDYGATAEELESHFHGCGSINRVTILCNKFDGHPKGFAYIEFGDRDSVQTAMAMDESLFRGRQIKVRYYTSKIFQNLNSLLLYIVEHLTRLCQKEQIDQA